jgi:hypothetical protein
MSVASAAAHTACTAGFAAPAWVLVHDLHDGRQRVAIGILFEDWLFLFVINEARFPNPRL